MNIKNICRKAYILLAAVMLFAVAPHNASAQDQSAEIAKTTLVKVGDKAADFTVEMLDGKQITLSKLKGKVVLVNFWATWCPPCREELKHVQKEIIDRFKGKDFVFLPISRGEKKATVEAFREKNGYTFAMGLDPKQSIFKLFASNYIPRNFLIGKDGKIVYLSVGYDEKEFKELISAIDKALKQAQADIQYKEAVKHFDEGNFEGFLDQFFKAIHSRYDIERPVIKRFIRKKLGIINHLKEENRLLKEKMYEQRKSLEKYAKEYYQMGNECITQAHDAHAAIANYDKAIELYPTYTDAWVRKGITLFNEKEYYEAEVCLNEAVRLSPMLFKAVYNRGKIRLALDNIEGALGDLDRAISLKPEHPKAHELFGDALMKAGKEEEATIHWALAERLREKKKK